MHAIAFGLLAALAYFALRAGHGYLPPFSAFSAWLLSSMYGAADEIHQAFVPTRQPDLQDLLADTIGAALAVAFLLASERVIRIDGSRRGQRRRSPAIGGVE
jgi:VanZ family protein